MYKITIPEGKYETTDQNKKGEREKKENTFFDFVQLILQHSKDQTAMTLDEIYLRGKTITEVEALKSQNLTILELSDDKYKILRSALDEMAVPKKITFMTGASDKVSRWEFIKFPILSKPEICLPYLDNIKNATKEEPKPTPPAK